MSIDNAPGKILIAYTDAGGGHKATALALKAILEDKSRYDVVLMNPYKTLIPDVDLFARFTPYTDEAVYNRFVLGKGWNNLFCLVYYAATLLNIRLGTRTAAKRFAACWRKEAVDLVISVMPMCNQGLYRSVRACFPEGPAPFLVVMTDLQESMKYTWLPREEDYFIFCGTAKAHQQALNKPHPAAMVFRTDGLVVHPHFYQPVPTDIETERRTLGLLPDLPTGCVMYGGSGSPRMAEIARALKNVDRKIQMVFLCGRDEELAVRLQRMRLPYPHVIRTFTPDVPYYFSLCDFLVGKPGPGTISEAMVAGIMPVLDIQQVLPQERYNVQWLRQHRHGRVFRRIDDLTRLIRELPAPGPIRSVSSDQKRTRNGAVFEIPDIVEKILLICRDATKAGSPF